MKKLYYIRPIFTEVNRSFYLIEGETARGIRVILDRTSGLEFHNFIKIDDEVFETDITNVTDTSFDIIFPSLSKGSHKGEFLIKENGEILKSGIYQINCKESIISSESSKLQKVDADNLLLKISKFLDEYETIDNIKPGSSAMVKTTSGLSSDDFVYEIRKGASASLDVYVLKDIKPEVIPNLVNTGTLVIPYKEITEVYGNTSSISAWIVELAPEFLENICDKHKIYITSIFFQATIIELNLNYFFPPCIKDICFLDYSTPVKIRGYAFSECPIYEIVLPGGSRVQRGAFPNSTKIKLFDGLQFTDYEAEENID